jgi:outer membrane protein OmpA-like peptidoglycan-associated protein
MYALKKIVIFSAVFLLAACQSTTSPGTAEPSSKASKSSSPSATGEHSTQSDDNEYITVYGTVKKPKWQQVELPPAQQLNQPDVELIRYQYDQRYLDMLNLTSDILFDFDRAALKPRARQIIDNVLSSYLTEVSEQYIYVVGHTDSDGAAGYNIGLSLERATSVVKSLKHHGLNTDRLFVIPAGEHMPKVGNSSADNKAKNRRVEIYLSPWRDMAMQFIRDWDCPVADCDYARVSLLAVDRDYQLMESKRDPQFEQRIMPMASAYERETPNFETQVRNVPDFPVEVRDAKLQVEVRKVPKLGKEYQADISDVRVQRLVKQLEQME